jgi:hypothetical protein
MGSLNPNLTTGSSVLVFLRYLAAPVVLYSDNPITLYDEIRRHIQQATPASPKLLEKAGAGPLKKVSFFDTEITGVAIQTDQPALR